MQPNDNFDNFGPNRTQNHFIGNNIGLSSMTGGSPSGVPPPLPPRPNPLQNGLNNTHNNMYRYGGYGSGLGANQLSNYSPYSSYSSMYSCNPFNTMSPFGGYGFNNMNRYNTNYNGNYGNENDFVRIAEESSRQAFQSIESIVQAFGSVSMMLESTYYAVHSSFRAVIGVADHFSRLRQHLAQILSTLAIIRTLKWIVRRILHLLGVRRVSTDPEERAWNQASSSDASNPLHNSLDTDTADLVSRSRSSWPIIIFFGVVFGTPWLIWRLLSTITGTDKTGNIMAFFIYINFNLI